MEDQAAFCPDGRSIALVGTASGDAELYVLPFTPETTQPKSAAVNVTNHPGGDFRPDFSPDGARIAFTTDRDTPVAGHPVFAFTRQREGDVYVMDRDGKNQRRLTATPEWVGSPKWSADGRKIVCGAVARGRRSAAEPDPRTGRRLADLGYGRRPLESARRDARRHRGARAGRHARRPRRVPEANGLCALKHRAHCGRRLRRAARRGRHGDRLLAARFPLERRDGRARRGPGRCRATGRRGDPGRRRAARGDHPANPIAFFGTYLEVVRNERIVWTNEESGPDRSVTTVTFAERDGKTTLVLREIYPTKEGSTPPARARRKR